MRTAHLPGHRPRAGGAHLARATRPGRHQEMRVRLGEAELGVAVVSGLQKARRLLDEIRAGRKDLHFIEVMSCPGGCISGGGQTLGADVEAVRARMAALYALDEASTLRTAHGNPAVRALYDEFLGQPLGERSHSLLHTHYQPRDVACNPGRVPKPPFAAGKAGGSAASHPFPPTRCISHAARRRGWSPPQVRLVALLVPHHRSVPFPHRQRRHHEQPSVIGPARRNLGNQAWRQTHGPGRR
jgi:hypothetical protein